MKNPKSNSCLSMALAGMLLAGAAFAATPPTPRMPDGKPDFSGLWGRLTGEGAVISTGDIGAAGAGLGNSPLLNGTPKNFANWITLFEADGQVNRRRVINTPVYKPEYWNKIRASDWNYSRARENARDCQPSMPRLGAPTKIVQLPNEIIFFYESMNRFRIIPTDGRARDQIKVDNPSNFGDSKGRWEGDTLVVDTVGVTSEAWIGPNGYEHSDDMKVTERYTRDGDTLRIDIAVEDPALLLEPWHMNPVTTRFNANQKQELWEELHCEDRDAEATRLHPHEGR